VRTGVAFVAQAALEIRKLHPVVPYYPQQTTASE